MIKYLCDVCSGEAFAASSFLSNMEHRVDDQCLTPARVSVTIQFYNLKILDKPITHICKNCLCRLIKSANLN